MITDIWSVNALLNVSNDTSLICISNAGKPTSYILRYSDLDQEQMPFFQQLHVSKYEVQQQIQESNTAIEHKMLMSYLLIIYY